MYKIEEKCIDYKKLNITNDKNDLDARSLFSDLYYKFDFQKIFSKNKTNKIKYHHNKEIISYKQLVLNNGDKIFLRIIKTNSILPQGFWIVLKSGLATYTCCGKSGELSNNIYWEDELIDNEILIHSREDNTVLNVFNFDKRIIDDKIVMSRGASSAMQAVKSIEDRFFRFRCNDSEEDDDFDGLIFELEIKRR